MSLFVDADHLPRESRPPTPTEVALPTAAQAARGWYSLAKSLMEFIAAVILLIFTAPLILLAMMLIKLTSPGPAIYQQTRVGRNGKPFTIYKLRTMADECESLTGATWCKPGDTRITTVGRWLRKTHIDELPQLWNVIKGDMSLIGPRPERPEFVPQLEAAIPLYHERLLVRPGVTGFAQIQLPPDSDLESVRIKLAYDLYYICRGGFFFDLRIYFATLLKVVGFSYEAIARSCGFTSRDAVDDEYMRLTIVQMTEAAQEPAAACSRSPGSRG